MRYDIITLSLSVTITGGGVPVFSEKLDLLMNITKTRNNVLAHAVSLDASHVSRLRRGGRALPKNKGFLEG